MPFNSAHNAVVLYALDNAPITEGTSDTPATIDDIDTQNNAPQILGYTNLPQTSRGLNNSKGFAIGQQGAAYNKRGAVQPQLEIEIRPGSLDAFAHFFPANGVLPYLALYVVVQGQYTDMF